MSGDVILISKSSILYSKYYLRGERQPIRLLCFRKRNT